MTPEELQGELARREALTQLGAGQGPSPGGAAPATGQWRVYCEATAALAGSARRTGPSRWLPGPLSLQTSNAF